jgi:hypothetical protein
MKSPALRFDKEDAFVVSQSLNELLHGLPDRADRPKAPGTLSEFRKLLKRFSRSDTPDVWAERDIVLSEYAVEIVLAELDESEIHARLGRRRDEIETVWRKLFRAVPSKLR